MVMVLKHKYSIWQEAEYSDFFLENLEQTQDMNLSRLHYHGDIKPLSRSNAHISLILAAPTEMWDGVLASSRSSSLRIDRNFPVLYKN